MSRRASAGQRRPSIALFGAAVIVAGALALNVAPAVAAPSHVFSGYLGAAGSTPRNPYPLSNPAGVAVDNSSGASQGDFYVTDPANYRVEKFDPSGHFILMFGRDVNQTTGGNVCIAASSNTCQAGTAGSSPGEFQSPTFVFVDPSEGPSAGDVYVGDTGDSSVSKFDSAGNLITSWGEGGQLLISPLYGIAVDPSGNLFVLNSSTNWYEQSGTLHSTFGYPRGSAAAGLAVDAADDLYKVDGSPEVTKFSDTGEGLGEPDRNGGTSGLTIDPGTGDLYAIESGAVVDHFAAGCNESCPVLDSFGGGQLSGAGGISINATSDNAYVANGGGGNVAVFAGANPVLSTETVSEVTAHTATLHGHVDPIGRGEVTACALEWGTTTEYSGGSVPCEQATPYAGPTDVTAKLSGLTTNTTYHYRIAAANGNGTYYGQDRTFAPSYVLSLSTDAATSLAGTSATLNGSFDPNGEDTHYYFEWGTTSEYGQVTAAPPGMDAGSTAGVTSVHLELGDLDPVTSYHYRIVASNAQGTSDGSDRVFSTTTSVPLTREFATDVHSESALLNAEIDPAGLLTTYHFEYGTADCSSNPCTKVPPSDLEAGSSGDYQSESIHLDGLSPDTTYHFRVVATNTLGSGGYDATFTTFPFIAKSIENCPNSLARQQTGAAQLLDCRAYELVSAANAGGYDVESDLAPGETPYGGYPQAQEPSRVLYGVHDGGIPGTNHPTNRGVDPYVATRGKEGWSTEYVGVPADNPFAAEPFSSVPSGADASLDTFAFGGSGSCSPCFEGGYTGIPIHRPNGSLVQGMMGSLNPGPSAEPDGYVAKDLSSNGEHFVFGSTSQFEPDGNSNGDVSIYDRNLSSGETHVVSKTPAGANLPCLQGSGECNLTAEDANGIAELDISANGSRVLVGQKVGTEAGNNYWHLYMDVGDSSKTVDLTPGTTHGVLFDGMTEDGSKVFFTTTDKLLADDTDASADIYQAEVSESGADLTRITTGTEGTGNTDSCDPVSSLGGSRPHWNSLSAVPSCDVVAIGGAGGIGAADGSVYFLSPEKLDGSSNGTLNQPNLYVARPASAPRFIATLEPNDPAVVDSVTEAEVRKTADFEVTPSGEFAVFTSVGSLTGYENVGDSEAFRYDASSGALDCATCNPTNAGATGNAALASDGLSLTEAGQVFFDSEDVLTLRDTDNAKDVYEWEPQGTGDCESESPTYSSGHGDCVSLISSGSSPISSSLLGVTENGTDAYFFTHDSLAAQDHSGPITKIYDARAKGGFFEVPTPPPCAASDECHGAGSQAPGPPEVRTNAGSPANYTEPSACKSGFVAKHGRCVRKKPQKPKRHHRRAVHRHHGG